MTSSVREVTILLVEDDHIDQEAVKRAFQKLKIANPLVVAEDGKEALQYLRSDKGPSIHRPFIIILDLNLPRLNGIEFLKSLRSDQKLKDSVVFVLTTSKDEEDIVAAYQENVAGYMVKQDLAGSFMQAVSMLEHYWKIVEFPK